MLTLAQVQATSASRLNGLNPIVRQVAEELIVRTYNAGVPIVITQGLRTIEYQNQLFAQGRTAPGKIVTNAKGGQSFHNFGLAIDFALLMPDGRAVSWDTYRDGDKDGQRDWLEVAKIGKEIGFEWGGEWSSFVDMPHFQMVFGLTTTQLRAGAKPPTEIKVEENQPMTKQEQQAFEKLEKQVGEITSAVTMLAMQVKALGEQVPPPKWFEEEFEQDKVLEQINTKSGSVDFWRALAVSLRAQGKGSGRQR